MNPIKVMVYEDQREAAKGWANKITEACGGAEVTTPERDDFQELVKLANERRALWRKERIQADFIRPHEIDEADIVVVDFDLLYYSDATDTTGSSLSYLIRCFSGCGFIIVLNEHGENPFDLTLERQGADFADLHVGGLQIGNPGLWQVPFEGYRPWHWPIAPHARANFELCVEDVRNHPNEPILEFLGLADKIYWMPQRALNFLSGDQPPEEITFEAFVKSARGGISRKDELPPDQEARVTAARIIHLLNGMILPEQNLLVDAPHLVSRFPSLLRSGTDDIEAWNHLCNPVHDDIDHVVSEILTDHKFSKSHWLWRPAWLWPEINRDERIDEVKNPWNFVQMDWVFCENVSRFLPSEIADSFRATFTPPFIRRFVFKKAPSVAASQMENVVPGSPLDPSAVIYEPQATFSE